MVRRLMTVDTGFSTGWAIWKNTQRPITGQITLPRQRISKIEDRLAYMFQKFDELLTAYRPTEIIIEGVELWGNSVKSQTSGVRGDLFKLAYLVGGYISIAERHGLQYGILNFKDWGGQLSPEAVQLWVKRVLNKSYKTQHITDAVAMGLSYFGQFKKSTLQKM